MLTLKLGLLHSRNVQVNEGVASTCIALIVLKHDAAINSLSFFSGINLKLDSVGFLSSLSL